MASGEHDEMLILSVASNGWGTASSANVRAVALSAASTFESCGLDCDLAVVLRPALAGMPYPMAESSLDAHGGFVVRVTTSDRSGPSSAYQFAHEYCHVLADTTTWVRGGPYAWVEQSLAERPHSSRCERWPTPVVHASTVP